MASGVSILGIPGLNLVDTNAFQYGPKGDLAPETALAEQGLNRKQQIANLLIQRGLAGMPQGQMAGRFYVPPSPVQGLANLAQILAGAYGTHRIDESRKDLAKQDQDMVLKALEAHRAGTAPQQVQTKETDIRRVNGEGVSPGLPYGIDPNVMPSQGFDPSSYQWGQDPSRQVSDNVNQLALALSGQQGQPAQAPLAGVPQQMNPLSMELTGPINAPPAEPPAPVDPLQQALDQGQQYTRQPFQQPQSQVTVSGPEFAMQERTPEERRAELMKLIAHPHPRVAAMGKLLAQQEQQTALNAMEREQQERFHKDDVGLRTLGITENAAGRMATIQNTMAMKEMDIAQREAARQDTRALRESLEADKREMQRLQLQIERSRLDETGRHNKEIEAISKENVAAKQQKAEDQDLLVLQNSTADLDRLAESANQLLNHPGLAGISGVRGKIPDIPGTDAADARALINKLKSQVGFSVLQNMRNNSKTGGALGNVSDNEGKRLENNLASLENTQSLEQLKQELNGILKYVDDSKNRFRDAFDMKYKGKSGTQLAPQQAPTPTQPSSSATGKVAPFDDAEKERRYQEWKKQHK